MRYLNWPLLTYSATRCSLYSVVLTTGLPARHNIVQPAGSGTRGRTGAGSDSEEGELELE